MCLKGRFEKQLDTVLNHIRLPEKQLRDSLMVVEDLKRSLQKHWPGSIIIQFGATTTGLALTSSDVDCFFVIPNRTQIDKDDITILAETQIHLQRYPAVYRSFRFDPSIFTPLLSFVHVQTQMPVDLTITRPIVMRTSFLLNHLLKLDKKILRLTMFIKYWSYVHGVGGLKSSLSHYAMTLLVLFYLQQKNVLPPIASLQQGARPEVIDGWNTAFALPIDYHPSINESVYELLGGFFKYYSVFNFDNVISLYCGCIVKREQIENLKGLPNLFSEYVNNLKLDFAIPFQFGSINIQDIFELDSNVGKPWNNRTMLDKLKLHLNYAAEVYETVSSERFLPTVLKPHKNQDVINKKIFEEC